MEETFTLESLIDYLTIIKDEKGNLPVQMLLLKGEPDENGELNEGSLLDLEGVQIAKISLEEEEELIDAALLYTVVNVEDL